MAISSETLVCLRGHDALRKAEAIISIDLLINNGRAEFRRSLAGCGRRPYQSFKSHKDPQHLPHLFNSPRHSPRRVKGPSAEVVFRENPAVVPYLNDSPLGTALPDTRSLLLRGWHHRKECDFCNPCPFRSRRSINQVLFVGCRTC